MEHLQYKNELKIKKTYDVHKYVRRKCDAWWQQCLNPTALCFVAKWYILQQKCLKKWTQQYKNTTDMSILLSQLYG